nr:class II D-tagatose-bisphosphate aldolase, non-catalytic subunit [uncultured Anaerostipes sp.]
MNNPLKDMVIKRKLGIHCGIPSFCCANKIVIEAILEHAHKVDDTVVIEATSNQVNQENGYMNMKPADFASYVYHIADKLGFSREKIIIGGDHMGPLPWADLPAETAMNNAAELVRLCVKAGYKKIHLDTSMYLGDDDRSRPLSDIVIARRGVFLYRECQKAYQEMLASNPDEVQPVYVVGSEVPIPGGNQEDSDKLHITGKTDFERTLLTYRQVFVEEGLEGEWNNIIAFVVQPGVEFANNHIHHYQRYAAHELCESLRKYPDIVFEGHSTDYQSPRALKKMVEDGIAIIKVGPALTFACREALFALSMMEKELISPEYQSHFMEVLEEEMLKNPRHWEKYYEGNAVQLKNQRKYSFSDRSRYYMSLPSVEEARRKLFSNMDHTDIPICMLHQYLPLQYPKVRDGKLGPAARELVKDHITEVIEDYYYAVKYNYMTNAIFIR